MAASPSSRDRTATPAAPAPKSVLEEVDACLARGEYPRAVRTAFTRVMLDVQESFGTRFPAHWTARDVLAHGLRPDSGSLSTLLFELYRLYEPIRFGQASDVVQGDVREIARRLYAETPIGRRTTPATPTRAWPATPGPTPTVPPPRPMQEVDRW